MSFDLALQQAVNGWAGLSPGVDRVMAFLADKSPYVYALLLLWAYLAPGRARRRRRRLAVSAGLAAVAALAVNGLIGWAWYRPRPFLVRPASVHVLVRHGADPSFPSDHAALAFALAAALWELGAAWGWPLLALGAAVAVARVFVGVHWPTDVLAGAAIGLVLGRLAVGLQPRLTPLLDRLLDALGPLGRDGGP